MATNKLMEAAAEILSGSKKSASGMPTQKLPGSEYTELGGPTNKPAEGEDRVGEDPYKDYEVKVTGTKQAQAPSTKPSSASPDDQNKPVGGKKTIGEEEVTDEEDRKSTRLNSSH